MKQYPSNYTKENIFENLKNISQIRDEDVEEYNQTQRKLSYNQGFYPKVREVSANTALGPTDYMLDVDTSAGSVTIILPTARGIGRQVLKVAKNDAANTLTVDGNGKDINGSGTCAWTQQYRCYEFTFLPVADEWRITASFL